MLKSLRENTGGIVYAIKNFFKKKPDHEKELADWIQNGRPVPPPHAVKQQVIRDMQQQFNTRILVETGTYMGDMVALQKDRFDKLYSIELSEKFYKRALRRFRNDKKITLLQGDSAYRLKEIMPQLNGAALFWLDGHYSGGNTAMGEKECPVREELAFILPDAKDHVILIDDARLFDGTHDYPTMEELQSLVNKYGGRYRIENADDIIRLLPGNK